MNAIWISERGEQTLRQVYQPSVREKLEETLHFMDSLYSKEELPARMEELQQVDYIFTTWGMLSLTEEEIEKYFPRVKAVFYGAGSVQYFARPFLNRGIRVFSSATANAVPVAEYTVAQIILAGKGYYQASRLYKQHQRDEARRHSEAHPGNYGATVGLIGAGMIGKLVIRMLKAYSLKVKVFDPFLSAEAAAELGVEKCSLEDIFSQCTVISNHLANNEQTRGMLNYSLFSRMSETATFINTGRGAQVVEEDLVRALTECPDRTAVLDVTMPEPVEEGHPFYDLDNVILTPHIAGSMQDEVARMGEYQADEYLAVLQGREPRLEVTLDLLKTMA